MAQTILGALQSQGQLTSHHGIAVLKRTLAA